MYLQVKISIFNLNSVFFVLRVFPKKFNGVRRCSTQFYQSNFISMKVVSSVKQSTKFISSSVENICQSTSKNSEKQQVACLGELFLLFKKSYLPTVKYLFISFFSFNEPSKEILDSQFLISLFAAYQLLFFIIGF